MFRSLIASFAIACSVSTSSGLAAEMEQVAEITEPIGNMTFTPSNRKIFSVHPLFKHPLRVAELTSRNTFEPFPNLDWNTPKENSGRFLDDVLGVRSDENGIVWMLDMGTRSHVTPKLVGWNTNTNQLERIYYIPAPASISTSQLNDMVIDNLHHAIYIADEGIAGGGDGSTGAFVIIDMITGECRRALQGDKSTRPEENAIMFNGKPLMVDGAGGKKRLLKIGNDGIAADKNFEWLYYGPINTRSLYRLKISDLLDAKLDDKSLSERVERYSDKENNGGLSLDNDGNVYYTEIEHHGIGIVHANSRKNGEFAASPALGWPDGVSYSPDGFMYVSDSQIDKTPLCNDGKALYKAPYLLFRFKPLAPGRVGH